MLTKKDITVCQTCLMEKLMCPWNLPPFTKKACSVWHKGTDKVTMYLDTHLHLSFKIEKQKRIERIKQKRAQLQELLVQVYLIFFPINENIKCKSNMLELLKFLLDLTNSCDILRRKVTPVTFLDSGRGTSCHHFVVQFCLL